MPTRKDFRKLKRKLYALEQRVGTLEKQTELNGLLPNYPKGEWIAVEVEEEENPLSLIMPIGLIILLIIVLGSLGVTLLG